MAGSIAPVNIDLRVRTGEVAKGIADVKSRVNDLDRSVQRIGRGAGSPAYAGAFKSIRRDAQATTRAVNETKAATSGLLKMAVKGLVAGATLGVGVLVTDLVGNLSGGLSTAVKESVMLAAEAEKSALAFEVMLGSADAAGRMLAQLRAYSAESPFNSKDVSDAAKQLIAFGFDADQALPTIRALGDVASGVGVPLGQLVNAYGQVATAGRLMGTELLQFTQAGVPIIDALATVLKKPKEDIKALVEQGRVGFPVVVRAFKLMTEEGGKFAGMGDRYGKSMAGLFEQLQDAAELAQTEFGRVVIEETGLKDATRDLTAFTGRIRDMANELRPAVRFAGDLVKAGAQIGNEFAKAGALVGRMQLDAYVRAVPELREMAGIIERIVRDGQDFTIDPVDIVKFGFVFTEGAVAHLKILRDGFVSIGGEVKTGLIDPLVDGAKSVKEVAEEILNAIQMIRHLQGQTNTPSALPAAKLAELKMVDQRWTAIRAAGEAARMKALNSAIRHPAFPRPGDLAEEQARLARVAKIREFIDEDLAAGRQPLITHDPSFQKPGELYRSGAIRAGIVDVMAGVLGGAGANSSFNAPRKPPDLFDRLGEDMRKKMAPMLAVAEEMRDANIRRREERRRDEFQRSQETIYVQGAGLVGGAFNALGQSARQAAAELQALKVPTTVDPSITDAAKRANDLASQLDPVGDLRRQIYGIRFAFQNGLIQHPELRDRAMAEVFRKATAGIDWQFRLPSAAEYGTTDFARAQALAAGGVVGDSAAAKLQALVEYTQQERDEIKKLAEELRHLFPLLAIPARLGP